MSNNDSEGFVVSNVPILSLGSVAAAPVRYKSRKSITICCVDNLKLNLDSRKSKRFETHLRKTM